jgi:predicted RNA-binding protein associated with RNAse of E/G family
VFYDLFLDVVADEDGKAMIIDEDELLGAYKDGVIDAEEYDLARTVASQVLDLFSENKDNLETLIRKCRNELNA